MTWYLQWARTVVALVWAVPAVALAQDIHLACEGTATGHRDEPMEASGSVDQTGQTFSLSGSTERTVSEADEVLIEINGDSGRIKLPRRLIPVLHTKADDGWRTFSSLTVPTTSVRRLISPLSRSSGLVLWSLAR